MSKKRRVKYCPTPRKARFYSEEEAEQALRKDYPSMKVPVRAYRCEGGHYHLTSTIAWKR